MKKNYIKAKEFDAKFEQGEDILKHLDITQSVRINQNLKRVNVDFPIWMINSLDKEAQKIGVTRQAIIKIWLAEKLKETAVAD